MSAAPRHLRGGTTRASAGVSAMVGAGTWCHEGHSENPRRRGVSRRPTEGAPFPSRDPWALILRENRVPVDDATREEIFRPSRNVGPRRRLLGAPHDRLVAAIARRRMRLAMRADKLIEASKLRANRSRELRCLAREGGAEARRALKSSRASAIRAPMFFAGSAVNLAPAERPRPRVAGFAKDAKLRKTYRAAAEAVAPGLPEENGWPSRRTSPEATRAGDAGARSPLRRVPARAGLRVRAGLVPQRPKVCRLPQGWSRRAIATAARAVTRPTDFGSALSSGE